MYEINVSNPPTESDCEALEYAALLTTQIYRQKGAFEGYNLTGHEEEEYLTVVPLGQDPAARFSFIQLLAEKMAYRDMHSNL